MLNTKNTLNMASNTLTATDHDDVQGQTKLHNAVLTGDHAMCRHLMKEVGDVNTQDNDGSTALKLASEAGRIFTTDAQFSVF